MFEERSNPELLRVRPIPLPPSPALLDPTNSDFPSDRGHVFARENPLEETSRDSFLELEVGSSREFGKVLDLVVRQEGFEGVETALVVPGVCEDFGFELLRNLGDVEVGRRGECEEDDEAALEFRLY